MSLKDTLAALSPKDSDATLAKIWKDFKGTVYFEALLLALGDLRESALAAASDPRSPADTVRHSAGRLYAVSEILSFMKQATTFRIDDAFYNEPLVDALDAEDNTALEPEEDPLIERK